MNTTFVPQNGRRAVGRTDTHNRQRAARRAVQRHSPAGECVGRVFADGVLSGFATGGRFVTVTVISELFVPPIVSDRVTNRRAAKKIRRRCEQDVRAADARRAICRADADD